MAQPKRETLTVRKGLPEKTHRDHVDKMVSALKTQREDHESDWHAIADFSGYGRIPFLMKASNGNDRPRMRQLMDSHPIYSYRAVEAGMYSGLSSPNRPWLRFRFSDPELNDYQPAAQYLDELERVVLDLFDASNFYQTARQNYGDMAHFGPACGMMTEHWREIAPCFAYPIGSYWFSTDDAGVVDTMARSGTMTISQVIKKFVGRPGGNYDWSAVSTNIKNLYDQSNYASKVSVMQLIEPAEDGKWDSTLWDANDDRQGKVLERKTYSEKPFWGPRWKTRDGDVYGMGLGHETLADMRELQMQGKSKRDLTDYLRKPPTVGPAKDIDMRPGAHTYVADATQNWAAQPVWKVDPNALLQVREDIRELRQKIDVGTYADFFLAITNMPGVQPRNVEELVKREEEKLTMIGPVVEIVNDEMLPVAVERMLGIARRGGLLPPAPEELQGRELKLEFVSILAMAARMMNMSSTERVIGFVGSLGSVFGPDVLDTINADEIAYDYARRADVPAKAMRKPEDVAILREQRSKMQQAAQAASMAGPASDAADAAATIYGMSNRPAA